MVATTVFLLTSAAAAPVEIEVPAAAPVDIDAAIQLGRKYRNLRKLWTKEMKTTNRLKMSGFWNGSGSKYLSVYTPFSMIALAAAQANHEKREFGSIEARELPGLDSLRVIIEISGFGYLGIARVHQLFGSGAAHMLIEIGDRIIQPSSKKQVATNYMFGPQFWNVDYVGNVAVVSNWGPFDTGGVSYEFLYPIAALRNTKDIQFVLLGPAISSTHSRSTLVVCDEKRPPHP